MKNTPLDFELPGTTPRESAVITPRELPGRLPRELLITRGDVDEAVDLLERSLTEVLTRGSPRRDTATA